MILYDFPPAKLKKVILKTFCDTKINPLAKWLATKMILYKRCVKRILFDQMLHQIESTAQCT